MDEAIRVQDITGYIQRRRASLATHRDAVESPTEKGKIIGMLQALGDFEGMIHQLRVVGAPVSSPLLASKEIPHSCEQLADRWLSSLDLPDACLEDFRDDKRQNQTLRRHPEKRQGLVALGQLLRNRALVNAVLGQLQARTEGATEELRNMAGKKSGESCPHCGKIFKYAKALATHIARCPHK